MMPGIHLKILWQLMLAIFLAKGKTQGAGLMPIRRERLQTKLPFHSEHRLELAHMEMYFLLCWSICQEHQVISKAGNRATDSSKVAGTLVQSIVSVTLKTSLLLTQASFFKPAGNGAARLSSGTGNFCPWETTALLSNFFSCQTSLESHTLFP